MKKWATVEVQVTKDHTLKRVTDRKVNLEVVETEAVGVKRRKRQVAQHHLAVLDTAPTFVVVYFL
ncbi:hypothetical protein GLW07_12940 [Bacillus hwajinpoensis]|uniref:Uncharacterized protein n=1 Tax=Guptibacillus hwajinpoensis TaxID=208199 RepID=A0A845F0J7_9BACL|nr:hypothetical protein [Pseudalkalibacillus hwajinpoensis]MYL64257.1 hypothetical protein [Pseudalkalibacillus hwajinpoensis]